MGLSPSPKSSWIGSEVQHPLAEVGVELVPGLLGEDGQHAVEPARVLLLMVAEVAVELLQHVVPLHVEAEVPGLGVVQAFLRAAKVFGLDQLFERAQPGPCESPFAGPAAANSPALRSRGRRRRGGSGTARAAKPGPR